LNSFGVASRHSEFGIHWRVAEDSRRRRKPGRKLEQLKGQLLQTKKKEAWKNVIILGLTLSLADQAMAHSIGIWTKTVDL
jgi:hypothetical protein